MLAISTQVYNLSLTLLCTVIHWNELPCPHHQHHLHLIMDRLLLIPPCSLLRDPIWHVHNNMHHFPLCPRGLAASPPRTRDHSSRSRAKGVGGDNSQVQHGKIKSYEVEFSSQSPWKWGTPAVEVPPPPPSYLQNLAHMLLCWWSCLLWHFFSRSTVRWWLKPLRREIKQIPEENGCLLDVNKTLKEAVTYSAQTLGLVKKISPWVTVTILPFIVCRYFYKLPNKGYYDFMVHYYSVVFVFAIGGKHPPAWQKVFLRDYSVNTTMSNRRDVMCTIWFENPPRNESFCRLFKWQN